MSGAYWTLQATVDGVLQELRGREDFKGFTPDQWRDLGDHLRDADRTWAFAGGFDKDITREEVIREAENWLSARR